jgi:DNA polymerase-3 subunit gamma/tau
VGYLVLARKYRPSTLAELVGQDHIARALGNAVTMNRMPHALLFCGARGTGKTSTARIVARMLNCQQGPTVTPCGTCPTCTEITHGSSLCVRELDAASNRGIDEIRDLRAGVGQSALGGRTKVYIIDEAHMLTEQAANAFLKTLEEPPAHVVFILATTDPHKLPVTIRSRCQRYDFRRVRAPDVVAALGRICAAEGLQATADALYLVAREGDGSMRDSLTVLDQVISFAGETLDDSTVASLLGVADRNRIHQLMRAILGKDAGGALKAIAAAHDHGMDLKTFARTLAMEARDLLVVALAGPGGRDLIDRADSEVEGMAKLAASAHPAELERLAHVLLEIAEQTGRARHPRLVLEMGLVRLCRAAALVDVAQLAAQVEALLAAGPRVLGGAGGSQGAAGSSTRPGSGIGGPAGGSAGGRLAAPDGGASSQAPQERTGSPSHGLMSSVPASPVSSTPSALNRPLVDADLAALQQTLRDMGRSLVATVVDNGVVESCEGRVLTLAFGGQTMTEEARTPETSALLKEAADRTFGGHWTIAVAAANPRALTDSPAALRRRARAEARERKNADLRDHPLVQALLTALDGTVLEVITPDEERH